MQTVYYTTTNFIRHTDNVVDLNEYRRKLELAQEGSLAPQPEVFEYDFPAWGEWEAPAAPETRRQPDLQEVRPRRTDRRERRAWMLDACASLGILIMTLTFSLQILL